jgi:hypothetical protein
LLNQFVTKIYSEKKAEGLVNNIEENKIIYELTIPGKNRKKCVCVYIDPRIQSRSNNAPSPVFSNVSGIVVSVYELGFATCTQKDLEKWYKDIGNKKYENIMDLKTGRKKFAKEYLHGEVIMLDSDGWIKVRQGGNSKFNIFSKIEISVPYVKNKKLEIGKKSLIFELSLNSNLRKIFNSKLGYNNVRNFSYIDDIIKEINRLVYFKNNFKN